jgi:hypothetical protein
MDTGGIKDSWGLPGGWESHTVTNLVTSASLQLPVVPIHRKRWLGELSPGSFQESLETKKQIFTVPN